MKALPKLYVCANALGLLLYAIFVLRIQNEIHAEQRQYPDFGDSIAFAATALPVLAAFAAANVSWGIWASIRLVRYREHQSIFLGASMLGAWVAIVVILRQLS